MKKRITIIALVFPKIFVVKEHYSTGEKHYSSYEKEKKTFRTGLVDCICTCYRLDDHHIDAVYVYDIQLFP